MTPTGTLIGPPLALMVGSAFHVPIATFVRGTGGKVKARYKAGDSLTSAVYQRGVIAPIFQPTADWYTRPDFDTNVATQTGYDEGEVVVHGTSIQAAKFRPGRSYNLEVTWIPAANPGDAQMIVFLPLAIGSPY